MAREVQFGTICHGCGGYYSLPPYQVEWIAQCDVMEDLIRCPDCGTTQPTSMIRGVAAPVYHLVYPWAAKSPTQKS